VAVVVIIIIIIIMILHLQFGCLMQCQYFTIFSALDIAVQFSSLLLAVLCNSDVMQSTYNGQ